MRKNFLAAICLSCALSAGAGVAPAQSPENSPDSTSPSYDMKGQSLLDLAVVQKKMIDLAQTLPSDKLTWRPSPDARSFAEVFLHVAGERYGILKMMGAQPPASFNPHDFDKSTTDRERIIAELNQSWEFTQKTIKGMSNAEFAKLLPKLGPQANAGDVVYILVADAHEHLGQLVAYSRENGVVPPWTAERQKKKQAAAAGK
ncbi:MAG TPA: DinB family protein [Acidobacteriaceae bacterium]|nr:DinB family protein [Acidobacteriaceae bacterium]